VHIFQWIDAAHSLLGKGCSLLSFFGLQYFDFFHLQVLLLQVVCSSCSFLYKLVKCPLWFFFILVIHHEITSFLCIHTWTLWSHIPHIWLITSNVPIIKALMRLVLILCWVHIRHLRNLHWFYDIVAISSLMLNQKVIINRF
jgi:hypothetical protein